MDARPSFESAQTSFGTPAVVTPLGGPAVEVEAVWLSPDTVQVPSGGSLQRAEPKRVLALPLDGLPLIPRGTIITAAEYEGGDLVDWKVDAMLRVEHDHFRVVVVPAVVTT